MIKTGGEGGTGAAPPEFSNSVGTPLVDAVALTQDLLTGTAITSINNIQSQV
jgi:glutamate synthase domain-containing protein 2